MGTNRPESTSSEAHRYPYPTFQNNNNQPFIPNQRQTSSGVCPPNQRGSQYFGSTNYYPPPPPPPRPPQAMTFRPFGVSEPLPPGINSQTREKSIVPPPSNSGLIPPGTEEVPNIRSFEPLSPPPLPPLFPYLSPELALSFQQGASQCGTSFEKESSDLPFVPVIINDNDLKKMTEIVKTQVEESKQKNLLLYEDIIDQGLPKELKEMFQPLYCKLCKLTLSSPVVARDHYKGKRHNRAAEMWVQSNPTQKPCIKKKVVQTRDLNPHGLLNGIITQQQQIPGRSKSSTTPLNYQSFDTRNSPVTFPNQHGFDRRPAPVPLASNQKFNDNNRKRSANLPLDSRPHRQNEFIPAYRAALSVPGPARKKPKKEGGSGPNFGFCELCQVTLTSQINAEQHYNGKNHHQKLLMSRKNGQFEDSRFGIGLSFSNKPNPPCNVAENRRLN